MPSHPDRVRKNYESSVTDTSVIKSVENDVRYVLQELEGLEATGHVVIYEPLTAAMKRLRHWVGYQS
jgi:hypothetical protein